jgi:hypothetical protein
MSSPRPTGREGLRSQDLNPLAGRPARKLLHAPSLDRRGTSVTSSPVRETLAKRSSLIDAIFVLVRMVLGRR